jgi:hypothetical protein
VEVVGFQVERVGICQQVRQPVSDFFPILFTDTNIHGHDALPSKMVLAAGLPWSKPVCNFILQRSNAECQCFLLMLGIAGNYP